MQCWFWNIDLNNQEYFQNELLAGRLRQGWGYDKKLDLRRLYDKVNKNEELDNEEQRAWNRCYAMLLYINVNDLVVIKNLPNREQFTLVKITGKYNFQIDEKIDDYGHYLPISIIESFNKYSSLVPTTMINALNREQNPIRITYKHDLAVRNLSLLPKPDIAAYANTPETFKEKMEGWRKNLLPHLKESLHSSITPTEAEKLILEMLRHDGLEVIWNAGANEKGADLLSTVQVRYGLDTKLAIQVKKHFGIDNDINALKQIENAFQEHKVQAGLIVTMADTLGNDFQKYLDELRQKYNIQVLYGDDLYLRLLELIADYAHEIE